MAIIAITQEHIEQLKSPQGGYNRRAMEILGCWPLSTGWKERLVGKQIGDRRLRSAVIQAGIKSHFFRGNTRKHR